jgi:putative DNA primase/helicase
MGTSPHDPFTVTATADPRPDAPRTSADWPSAKREVLSRIDLIAEYRALGVQFAANRPSPKGWLECHAVGRTDDHPSAAVNVRSGVYKDSGGDGLVLGFFEFALKHGPFGRWVDCLRHYAEKAGVPLGPTPSHGRGRLREAVYLYRDADGVVRYAVFRYRLPNGKKEFSQHPPDGRGGWRHGKGCMDGVAPLPYRLPELLASAMDVPIWIPEGEKDVERLAAEGLVATTNHQGAMSTEATWPRFLDHFRGWACFVLPDNDAGGRAHARKVAGYLDGLAAVVKVVELPGLPPKGDVSDWLDSGHAVDELAALAEAAPSWTPGAAAEAEDGAGAEDDDDLPVDADVITACLSDVVAVPVEWLWPERVPLGKVTLFAGEAKMGKSFLTMDFAARISTGGPIPCGGGECMPTGSVVLLSAEDDAPDTIKPRLVAAEADTDKIHLLTTVRRADGRMEPFNLSYVPHLERAILRFKDTKLVIIDPISHYMGAGTDDFKAVQVRGVLGPLKELASRRRVAIVLVHHLNKGNGTKALNRVSGSGAYTALARSNWLVCKDPDDPKRRLFLSAGTNLVEEPSGLAYRIDRETARVVWEGQPVLMTADEALAADKEQQGARPVAENASKVEQAEAWLVTLLGTGAEVPSDDVVKQGEAKGFGRKTLFTAKERAGVKARKVGFQGGWSWYLPAEEPPNCPF